PGRRCRCELAFRPHRLRRPGAAGPRLWGPRPRPGRRRAEAVALLPARDPDRLAGAGDAYRRHQRTLPPERPHASARADRPGRAATAAAGALALDGGGAGPNPGPPGGDRADPRPVRLRDRDGRLAPSRAL